MVRADKERLIVVIKSFSPAEDLFAYQRALIRSMQVTGEDIDLTGYHRDLLALLDELLLDERQIRKALED